MPPGGSEGAGGENEQELDGFTIIVVELEPETNSTKKIDPSDYVATVVVSTRQCPVSVVRCIKLKVILCAGEA